MRDLLRRLRAALSVQVLLVLAALFLLLGGMRMTRGTQSHTALEARAAKTLSAVRGAGRVQVVIRTRKEETAPFSARQDGTDAVLGAVAVAQGADDPIVYMELQQALCALLGLPVSAVSIVTGGD